MGGGLLAACALGYALAAGVGLYRMRSRLFRPSAAQFVVFLAALALHTTHLVLRGRAIGRCPIAGLPDVLAFVAWSLALAYVVAGPAHRFAIPGILTAPMVALLLGVAWALPMPPPGAAAAGVEFHAASALLAYGALGLACVTGIFYLIHEHLIKTKRFTGWLDNLPSLRQLAQVNRNLLLYGVVLLTVGVVSGFMAPGSARAVKMALFTGLWLSYASIWAGSATGWLGARRTAWLSALMFAAMVVAFWTLSPHGGRAAPGP